MHRAMKQFVVAATGLILLAGSRRGQAAAVIDITQVGSDVVMTGTGAFDLTDLPLSVKGTNQGPALNTTGGEVAIAVGTKGLNPSDLYFDTVTGPSSLGSGPVVNIDPTSGTGDFFGLQGSSTRFLEVPAGYTSGTALSGTDTYANQTFATLSLTPGTYTYSWGTGLHADSLTIQVGPAAVPLPSSLAGGSVGFAMVAGLAWGRRKRPTV